MPKLSTYPAVDALSGTDLIPIVSGGATKKATVTQLVAMLPAGPQGEPGANGADGEDGADGAPGAAGETGPMGPSGNDGAPGATGAKGDKGDKGDTGNTGSTGGQGIQGIPGTNGSDGAPGAAGSTGPAGADGFGGGSVVKKTGDQTISTATPTNVTSLSFAVVAGRYYRFQFLCIVQSNTLTVGVAATVTTPAFTRFAARVKAPFAADGAGAEWQGDITASGDAVVPTAIAAINTDYILDIEGIIVPSANGTLQLQGRTETGTTNVTFRQGSMGFLWDLGA